MAAKMLPVQLFAPGLRTTAAFVVTTATVGVLVGGGGGGAVVVGGGVTVVLWTISVFPSMVVALVTVAVGANGEIPPFAGSHTPPPSWAWTVGTESSHSTMVAGGRSPGSWIKEDGAMREGQMVGYCRGKLLVAHVLSAVTGTTLA
jgi:hypothetical protein